MLFRIYLANADAREVAELGQRLGLSGTVADSAVGFGEWGVEPTAVVELAGADIPTLEAFVDALFDAFPEEASIYLTDATGLRGEIWWRDGRVE